MLHLVNLGHHLGILLEVWNRFLLPRAPRVLRHKGAHIWAPFWHAVFLEVRLNMWKERTKSGSEKVYHQTHPKRSNGLVCSNASCSAGCATSIWVPPGFVLGAFWDCFGFFGYRELEDYDAQGCWLLERREKKLEMSRNL